MTSDVAATAAEHGHDPLAGLDAVPWAQLSHAYGPACDVPEMLRALGSGRSAKARAALASLEGTIWHQGTVYDATAPAVRFLRALATVPGGVERARILIMLRAIATGMGYSAQHAGVAWMPSPEADELAEEQRWVRAARDAVGEGLDEYVAALIDDDRRVRAAAGYLLAAFAHRAETVVPALLARVATEPDRAARIGAVLALGGLAGAGVTAGVSEAVLAVLLPLLDERDRAVRAAAAIALSWRDRSGKPPRRVMRVLADSLGRELPALAHSPWAGGDVYELIAGAMGFDLSENVALIQETLAARSARRRADAVSRGSQLMYEWRDAPPMVVPVVAPALGDSDAAMRAHTAWVLARNAGPSLSLATDLLADALADIEQRLDLDHQGPLDPRVFGGDPQVREATEVLTALGRLGDPRCLSAVRRVLASGALQPDWHRALSGLARHAPALVPHLVEALRQEAASTGERGTRWNGIIRVLPTFGTAAAGLLPDLLEFAETTADLRVFEALAAATPPGHELAPQIAETIRGKLVDARPWSTRTLLPAYWRLSRDHDSVLAAVSSLIKRHPDTWREGALATLAELGPLAAPLLDRVRPVMTDETAATYHDRPVAAYAYWRITGDLQPVLPILLATLAITPRGLQTMKYLSEIGPAASAAIPILRDFRDRRRRVRLAGFNTSVDEDEEFRATAAHALERIDVLSQGLNRVVVLATQAASI